MRYITRAALAEADLLHRRRPIVEVVGDSATDAATRGKLLLVHGLIDENVHFYKLPAGK